MSPAPRPTEDEIHAYVDDALAPERRLEVAAILREDPALAARVAGYAADRDGLRLALTAARATPLPAAWQARIEASTLRRRALPGRRTVFSGLALAAASGVAALLSKPSGDRTLDEALAARGTGPDAPVPALAPAAGGTLLASALGLHLSVPDLAPFGFRLAGLQVIGAGHPAHAAQLTYSDAARRRLTIYVRRSDGSVRFDLLRRGGERVCIWQDDVVSAVIIAPMAAGEMMRVASSAYSALNL